jgi:hypothetical protein
MVGSARCADRTPQRGVPTTQDWRIATFFHFEFAFSFDSSSGATRRTQRKPQKSV